MRVVVKQNLGRKDSRRGERGYILALLLGVCTIMGIHLLKAIPAAHAEVQRELEADLIYRGEHLANGIEAYKKRTGAYPTILEQLIKLKPRLVRKLYTDPMTAEGNWVLVYGVMAGRSGSTEGLPIVGIRSASQKDSFRMYRNKTIYSDWVFSASNNLLGIPGSSNPQQAPVGNPTPPSAANKPAH